MAEIVTSIFNSSNALTYFTFTDATEAEYKLDVNCSNAWSGRQKMYVCFDANTNLLYFKLAMTPMPA